MFGEEEAGQPHSNKDAAVLIAYEALSTGLFTDMVSYLGARAWAPVRAWRPRTRASAPCAASWRWFRFGALPAPAACFLLLHPRPSCITTSPAPRAPARPVCPHSRHAGV